MPERNDLSQNRHQLNSSYSIRKMLQQRWLIVVFALALTGLGAALTGTLFKAGVHALDEWRLALLKDLPAWFVLPALGGLGGLGGLFSMGMPPGMAGGPGLGHNDWKEFNPFKEMGAKVHVFGPGVNASSSQIIPPISKSAEITLEQAYNGCSIGVEIKRQITYYNDNTTETEKVYFDIPEGADDNEIISIKEKVHVYN